MDWLFPFIGVYLCAACAIMLCLSLAKDLGFKVPRGEPYILMLALLPVANIAVLMFALLLLALTAGGVCLIIVIDLIYSITKES